MPVASTVQSASNTWDQLSRGNDQGTMLGQSSTDPVGFFGATPIARPSGNAQVVLPRGNAAGVITTYSTSQSPSQTNANTTNEASLTVQTGTGATMLAAAGDLFFVNKPTAQAGLGYSNPRVASSNTVAVQFGNWTSGNITPTSSESYSLVGIRGLPVFTSTLSPAAVAANTTLEQQFAVTGLPAGALVQVIKPTSQAGLIITGCRVVSNNVLGITFTNLTASPITPTAAESYTITALFGLDAVNNEIWYGFNVGTVGAIGVGVVASGGATTLTGLLATDMVAGIMKPTNGAAATNAAFIIGGIPTANTLTLYYGGIGTGATPTASEVYGIRTARLAPVAPLVLYTQTLTPTSVAANTTAEQTFTVTGLVSGSPVWVNRVSSAQQGLGIAGVRVSAANTLAITFCNSSGSAIVPNSETYLIGNFQLPAPGNGNSVYQSVSPVLNSVGNLLNAERAAMVSLGIMAGA